MNEQLLKSIPLETGHIVNIYDESKKIAADRWQINLTARLAITIDEIYAQNSTNLPPESEVRKVLGDTVAFEIKKQRNFIDAAEKDKVINDIINTFTSESVPYLSHPDFSRRLILKKYQKHKTRITR